MLQRVPISLGLSRDYGLTIYRNHFEPNADRTPKAITKVFKITIFQLD